MRHRYGGDGLPPFTFHRRHRLRGREAEHLGRLTAMFQGMVQYSEACQSLQEEECKTGMYLFMENYMALHALWCEGLPADACSHEPWHERPKMHALHHLVADQIDMYGSPSLFWNYRDEDYVGAIKRIASRTKHPRTLETRVCQKLMLLSGLHATI
jgi:hypothetical protein